MRDSSNPNKHPDVNLGGNRKWYKVMFYGTLMRGFENARLLFANTDLPPIYRGNCETVQRFHMTCENFIPYVSKKKEVSTIKGELWEMDSRVLSQVDILEGHPNWYERSVVELTNGEKAYLYFNERSRGKHSISDGSYRNHRIRSM